MADLASVATQVAVQGNKFDYLLEKIASAAFVDAPFKHIEIFDFLAPEHFAAIVGSAQIASTNAASTEELLDNLIGHGYQPIPFPGCVESTQEYLEWFHGRTKKTYHGATEGFGIVFRLADYRDPLIRELDAFFRSDKLRHVMMEKFGIERPVAIDAGIQKYLHGYEISPHPDIRRKALTWMLNINPGKDTESADYHTHYLVLKKEWKFISEFWRHNPGIDRDWLPWDWCETVKRQPKNNSIVLFSPSDDTIHAVKAHYDHLTAQRTQLYGNLWYEPVRLPKLAYHHFDLSARAQSETALKEQARAASAPRRLWNRLTGTRRARRQAQDTTAPFVPRGRRLQNPPQNRDGETSD